MSDKLRESISIFGDRPCYKCGSYNCDMSCEAALAEPTVQKSLTVAEQEPVAWMSDSDVGFYKEEFGNYPCVPLYTAPPRREWVGLTDDEKRQILLDDPIDWINAIESKLREKNK